MTIHKQKSKENPVDCSATYFPSSFQREKQRDGTDPTPSVPASLSASGSMCNCWWYTHSLCPENKQGIDVISGPSQRLGHEELLFHIPVHRAGSWSCPGIPWVPRDPGLDYLGREAALASVGTHRQTAVWTWSLSCCFRLHRLSLWGLQSMWSWLSLSTAKPVAKTHSTGSSPVLVRCPAGRLITAFPFRHSHETKFILLHCSSLALVRLVCKVFRLQLN